MIQYTKIVFFSAVFAVVVLAALHDARADWVNFSGAENARNIVEIRVNEDHVRLDLEIFVDDVLVFHRLVPDEIFERAGIERPSRAERLRSFSEEDFQIITEDGERLIARIIKTEQRLRKERPSPLAGQINPYTRQRIPGPPDDKRVLYVELEYPFKGTPESLTFIPPFDDAGRARVSIGFVTYHKGIPINDFRYVPQSARLMLDWEDPWYSEFEERNLKRWQRGAVTSYLYVEPFEVRHEILARVKDLGAWMDLGLRGSEYIEADENDDLRRRVGEFLLEQENLVIDGERLRPILDRTAFVKYSVTGSTFLTEPERLDLNAATVGVIITYLTEAIPDEVSYEWNLWSDRIQKLPATAIDPAGGLPSYLTPDDNVATWKNFLKTYEPPTVAGVELDESMTTWRIPIASVLFVLALVPIAWRMQKRRRDGKVVLVSVVLAILTIAASVVFYPRKVAVPRPVRVASSISDQDAASLLDVLMNNVYRSFDFRGEEDVYDKLSTSVHGDLLSKIYLESRQSLVVERAGGAQARVKEIEVIDTEITDSGNRFVTIRARWTALGTVGHWGHIHSRKNQYHAEIRIEPVDNLWKIMDLEVLEEERIL